MKEFRVGGRSGVTNPSPGSNPVDEDYDFCQDDACSGLAGAVPSRREVEEATRDLKASFVQTDGERCTRGPSSSDSEEVVCERRSSLDDTSSVRIPEGDVSTASSEATTSQAIEVKCLGDEDSSRGSSPPVSLQRQSVAVRGTSSNVVAHCVDLLQRDPDVQAAVISLARDPAVWDAFVKNEKVQELLRAGNGTIPDSDCSLRLKGYTTRKQCDNPLILALLRVRNVVFEVMDTLVDLVGNVFGFLDEKIFGPKDSDPLDMPLKACMVLTILVLALVVLKRV